MNSRTDPSPPPRPANWIVTTCRGRLAHLRESLPSWLEQCHGWEPVVVVCDDPEALEYASGEVRLAGRGLVIGTQQGQYFNRLEAIRLAVDAIFNGHPADGRTEHLPSSGIAECLCFENVAETQKICILDADVVALRATERALASVANGAIGIADSPTRDEQGFLIAPALVLHQALLLLPPNVYAGYGYEDTALRIACWIVNHGHFVRVPCCWAHRRHDGALRTRFHAEGMRAASTKNGIALSEFVAARVSPDDRAACLSDCLWKKDGHARKAV